MRSFLRHERIVRSTLAGALALLAARASTAAPQDKPPAPPAPAAALPAPPAPAPALPATAPAPPPAPAAPAAGGEAPPPPSVEPAPPPPPREEYARQEDLAGLRTDLENFKFQWQHERDLHTALSTRGLLIGGVIQGRIQWDSTPVNSLKAAPYSDDRRVTFDTGAAVLAFQGNLYKDYEEGRNLNYTLRFGASPQQATNNSFLNLLDANISYSPVPTINPESPVLTFTLGQQLLPFGIEVNALEELKPVIYNAQFTTKLNLARRDVGLIMRGDLFPRVDYGYNYRVAVLSYALGVVNGAGPNTADDNTAKDVIARLAFNAPTDYNSYLRQLTIGGTVYVGWQNLFLNDNRPMPSIPAPRLTVGKKHRYGADLNYQHFPFGVTYEFVYAQDDVQTPIAKDATSDDTHRVEANAMSHTATLFFSFGEQFPGELPQPGPARRLVAQDLPAVLPPRHLRSGLAPEEQSNDHLYAGLQRLLRRDHQGPAQLQHQGRPEPPAGRDDPAGVAAPGGRTGPVRVLAPNAPEPLGAPTHDFRLIP
jgi:hypothetical protein